MIKYCWCPPLNFTSSTSFSLSMMSPFGLKVWQGQCTLISRPRLVPDGKQVQKKGLFCLSTCTQIQVKHWMILGTNSFLEMRNDRNLSLTSVDQPLPHCLSHIEGDPFCSTFGQHILGCNVALFSDVFIRPHNLQGNNKWSLCKVFSQHWNSFNKITCRMEQAPDKVTGMRWSGCLSNSCLVRIIQWQFWSLVMNLAMSQDNVITVTHKQII